MVGAGLGGTDRSASEEPLQEPRSVPIWQPKPTTTRPAWVTAAWVVGGIALLVSAYVIAYEKELLSRPAGQVEVVVVRVETDKPQGKTPPYFRYLVRCPDGAEGTFISDALQPSGSRLLVTASRGRLTNRMWLGEPYVVLGRADPPARR